MQKSEGEGFPFALALLRRKRIFSFFEKTLAISKNLCYNTPVDERPVGQAAKTSPFHGENMGSIPVRVTKKESTLRCALFFVASVRPSTHSACAFGAR